MLWKCCTQYASKFGKLSSSHRTGKGQFTFQSQRKGMPKNVQTTTQLHSSHMQQSNAQNSPNQALTVCELWTSRCSSWIYKRQRNQRSNCQHLLDHLKSTWCKELTPWKKTLMLGKIEGRRRRGRQRMTWLDGITDSMDMSLSKRKSKSSRKTSISALLTMPKPLTMKITTNHGKFLKRWEYQTT